MKRITSAEVNSPIGLLALSCQEGKLIKIELGAIYNSIKHTHESCLIVACQQIKQYFFNPTLSFHIPFVLMGTSLQKAIWHEISTIPCGETKTYGQLAKNLQTHPRIIGNACRANPIPIIVPCHRVVAANGIGGYMGQEGCYLRIKAWLLQHEMKFSQSK